MYQVKFNDITSMHGQTNQTIQQWGESLKNLQESIASLANQSELQGKAMTSAKSYMTEVHGTFIQTLTLLMNEYTASFLLYKDGYYQIDTHNHAELPEDVYKGLHSDLGKSKQRFEQQLEQLTAAKLRVAGLVNYQGSSHTKTKFTYEKLMKDIKHLDESITQYEEMHARQDLQAFKELLAATKSLLAEHSSRDRSMGSYQVGDFRQLPSMNRFRLAVQQSAIYLNNHMPQFQAAQEREQLRVESIYAEERTKQGLMNLVFGVLTLVAGATALVMPVGAMWPIVVSAFKYGALVLSMSGASNSIEAVQNIYYGLSGNGKSFAINVVRDIFFGKSEIYNTVESVLTLTTGVFIPIAQTKSIAQGISQFFWGTVGSIATGQAAYHGTKLLGGNEETAQLMNLIGNFIGGYSAAKAVENFSLNGKTVPKVESALEIENLVLENIKASKTARELSNFKDFSIRERYLEKIFDKLTPEERELIFSISKNAPKVEYRPGKTAKSVLSIPKKERPSVEKVYSSEYIEAHRQQFKNGAIKIQKYTPEEGGYNNGAVGNIKDHVAFVMPKEVGEILIKVTKGDPELLEDILGLHRGDLGSSPVAIEIPPESIKNPRIPSGNEDSAFDGLWKPGGQTFPGNIPEAVIDEVPWGEFTIRKLGGD
ncbi:T7SS effector LXG polymorphic toxin [Granulicatella adiacens]